MKLLGKGWIMVTLAQFEKFLNGKINNYAQQIIDEDNRHDRSAVGELDFYVSLRTALLHSDSKNIFDRESLQSKGTFDAVNDTLIELGYVESGSHFLDKIET